MSAPTYLSDNGSLTPGPAFRASQMVDDFINSGDEVIDTSSLSEDVKVRAVRRSDGSVALMLIHFAFRRAKRRECKHQYPGSDREWRRELIHVQHCATHFGRLLIPALTGDFNHDGRVDAADYVLWRQTGGSSQEYAVWRQNFGELIGGAVSESSAVPEPSSGMLTLLVVAGLAIGRTRS
jgi:hypothetical protein